jgi:hypothetical protein
MKTRSFTVLIYKEDDMYVAECLYILAGQNEEIEFEITPDGEVL